MNEIEYSNSSSFGLKSQCFSDLYIGYSKLETFTLTRTFFVSKLYLTPTFYVIFLQLDIFSQNKLRISSLKLQSREAT